MPTTVRSAPLCPTECTIHGPNLVTPNACFAPIRNYAAVIHSIVFGHGNSMRLTTQHGLIRCLVMEAFRGPGDSFREANTVK